MKLCGSLLLLFGIVVTAYSQQDSQSYEEAFLFGSKGSNTSALGIKRDGSGNTYTFGTFENAFRVGSSTFRTTNRDAYLIKQDATGTILWAKQLGFDDHSDSFSFPGDIDIDASGNVYVTGAFSGDANIEGTPLTNNGQSDIYVAKYTTLGALVFVKNIGGADFDYAFGIAVDDGLNIYVTGQTNSNTITFNSVAQPVGGGGSTWPMLVMRFDANSADNWIDWQRDTFERNFGWEVIYNFNDANLYVAGQIDDNIFLRQYNFLTGVVNWDQRPTHPVGLQPRGEAFGLAINEFNDNVYMTGSFRNEDIQFGSLPPLTITSGSPSDDDVFIVAYDNTGTAQWSTSAGGDFGNDQGHDIQFIPISLAPSQLIVTGDFRSSSFDIGTDTYTLQGSKDVFLGRYDFNGNFISSTHLPSDGFDQVLGAAVNGSTSVFLAGNFTGNTTIGSTSFNNANEALVIAELQTSDFSDLNVHVFEKGRVKTTDVEIDAAGNVITAGTFKGTIDIQGTQIAAIDDQQDDIFVASFNRFGVLNWVVTAESPGPDEIFDLAMDQNDDLYLHAEFNADPVVNGNVLPIGLGGQDLIIKLDNVGGFVWHQAIDAGVGDISDIEGLNDGVALTGSYAGSMDVQGVILNSVGGSLDAFIYRLDAGGIVVDGRSFGDVNIDAGYGLHYTAAGELFMTGEFDGAVAFDAFILDSSTGADIFVAKFDASLLTNLAFNDGSPSVDESGDIITTDINGNIYLGGQFFGPTTSIGGDTFNGSGQFVSKYDNGGSPLWGRSIIESNFVEIKGLAVDDTENVFAVGEFMGTMDLEGTVLFPEGDADGWISQYNAAGQNLYREGLGTLYDDLAEGNGFIEITADIDARGADVWLTGNIAEERLVLGSSALQPTGGLDSYVALILPNTVGQVDFSFTGTCEGQTTFFMDESFSLDPAGNAIATTDWDFGDGAMSGLQNPSHLFTGPAIYQVTLSITFDNSQSLSITQPVFIYPPPTADAGPDETICSGDMHTLSGSTGGSSNTGIWTTGGDGIFDDTGTGTGSADAASTYAPGPTDISNGSVTLTLTGPSPIADCTDAISNVIITIESPPTSNAGTDVTICSGDAVTLAGTAGGGFSTTMWSSGGDGAFFDPTDPNTTYTPGPTDISGGSVTLTLDAMSSSGFCSDASDDVLITINNNPPSTIAGSGFSICSTDTAPLNGSISGSATSSTWSSSGDGTFDNAALLNAIYTPGATDISNGTVDLTITTDDPDGAGGCTAAMDVITINIEQEVTADAGPDLSVCGTGPANLSGTIGGSATDVIWTTAGDGGFDDNSSLTPVYTPGAADIASGTITITLDASSSSGICTSAMDQMIITLGAVPSATAGSDFGICSDSFAALNGTIGGAATTGSWSTAGDGTFDNPAILTANYTPGSADIAAGSVVLTLTTDDPDGTGPCVAATSNITVTIDAAHTADAGVDQQICPGDNASLIGVLGGSASSAIWTTSGDGTFDDPNLLSAVYTPGASDISTGIVDLTLTSVAGANCAAAVDQLELQINQPIIAVEEVRSVNIGSPVNIDVTGSATINPGDIILTTILTSPTKGTATIEADNSITYTASQGTVGADDVEYQICNQCNQCSSEFIRITINNEAPTITVPPAQAEAGGIVTIPLAGNIIDVNDNVDLNTLTITQQPASGAPATIDGNLDLIIDYTGVTFVGTDQLRIEVCDFDGLCATSDVSVIIDPLQIVVINALSPNGDNQHDFFEIQNIEFFPGNEVQIFSRWGDLVFETTNYNNTNNFFDGTANKGPGGSLPSGNYYYSINLQDGTGFVTGFLVISR